jgi:hypothetical protein
MAPRMAIDTPMPQKREVVNMPEATSSFRAVDRDHDG